MQTIRQEKVITQLEALDGAGRWEELLVGGDPIRLQLPELSVHEAEGWQGTLNSFRSACGCETGRMVMATFILAYLIYLLLRPPVVANAWLDFGVGFGLACVGAVVGKFIGLLLARKRLRQAVDNLRSIVLARR
mgnify:CR=1 FL=1